MHEEAGKAHTCPICFEASQEWYLFHPCRHFVCVRCSKEWLEVKHECLLCKTPAERVDRYLSHETLLDENIPLPHPSRKQSLADSTDQTASEALGKPYFFEEFTKLLQLISDKHSSYSTMKRFGSSKLHIEGIEKELEELQNVVMDSMNSIGDDEQNFNPLNVAHLLEGLHRDFENIGEAGPIDLEGFDTIGGYDMDDSIPYDECHYLDFETTIKSIVGGQGGGAKKQRKPKKKKKQKGKEPSETPDEEEMESG